MNNDKDIIKLSFIKRRTAIIQGTYWFLTTLLILKLFKLQIIEGILYKKKSKNNALRENFILPQRGIVYDRNGIEIANNIVKYKLVYYCARKINIEEINNVYKILNREYLKVKYNLDKIKKTKVQKYQTFVLAKNLTNNEIKRIKFNLVYHENFNIEEYYVRRYPYKNYTSALIGFVIGIRNTDNRVARINSDYKIGGNGIEKILENKIGGKIGLKYNVINATGKKINEIDMYNPVNGDKVITSINQKLQNKLSQLIEGKNGCATLIDIRTGGILAMSSTPNIDPNTISIGISDEEWQEITKDGNTANGLFTNKNISSSYPPGSTFKIVSGLTGLIEGIDPEKKYKCTGEHKIGNRIFHCWKAKQGGHGWVNFDLAIAQSCNCYFYNLSQQISDSDLYNVATKLGLGVKHLPDFSQEVSGLVPNAKWKKKKEGQIWFPGDTANMVLGQGYVNVTPLQLAIMVARIASNKKVEPKYLLDDEDGYFANLGFQQQYLDILKHGLFSVINAEYGIIYGMASKKYQICGKTGSAQVVSERIDNKDMKSGKVKIEKHSHALFVGFAPYDDPRYAVSVVVEHGIGGAYSAAPIGTAILSEAIKQETHS